MHVDQCQQNECTCNHTCTKRPSLPLLASFLPACLHYSRSKKVNKPVLAAFHLKQSMSLLCTERSTLFRIPKGPARAVLLLVSVLWVQRILRHLDLDGSVSNWFLCRVDIRSARHQVLHLEVPTLRVL